MSIFDQFINTTDSEASFQVADRANPANWSAVGKTIVFSLLSTISLGYQTVIQAVSGSISKLLTGVTEFFAGSGPIALGGGGDFSLGGSALAQLDRVDIAMSRGLLVFLGDEISRFIAAVWSFQLGFVPDLLRLPAGLALTVAFWWIATKGYRYAREEVF